MLYPDRMAKASGALSAAGNSVVLDVREANAAIAHLVGGGVNATGISVVFEGTLDNVGAVGEANAKWFAVDAARTAGNVAEAGPTALALNVGVALAYGWKIGTVGIAYLRARMTARTAGDVVATLVGTRFPVEGAPVNRAVPPTSVTATPPTGTKHRIKSAASTNLANLVNAACNLDELSLSNPTATAAYLKLYDKATAPVIGTDVPEVIIPIPANSFQQIPFPNTGKRFAAGLGHAITGAIAEADATAAVAGVIVSLTRH